MTFKEKILTFSLPVGTWMMVLFCCGLVLGALLMLIGLSLGAR